MFTRKCQFRAAAAQSFAMDGSQRVATTDSKPIQVFISFITIKTARRALKLGIWHHNHNQVQLLFLPPSAGRMTTMISSTKGKTIPERAGKCANLCTLNHHQNEK